MKSARLFLAIGLILGGSAVSAKAQTAATVLAPAVPRTPVGQGPNGDWAYLTRYREANQSAMGSAASERVVFMGDSITEGWAPQPFIRDNPHLIGRGISGQTAPQMLVRFRSDVIALKPRVVHIMAGTNDVAQNTGPETTEEILGYLTSMVELAEANGIRVVIASIPPAASFYWNPGLQPAGQIQELNKRLREYARRRGLPYVDYWSAMATPEGAMKTAYSSDGVHPNAAGYAVMGRLAQPALHQAMRGR